MTTKKEEATDKSTAQKKTRRTNNYLNNKDLLAEVIKSKDKGTMTDKLAHMLTLLCSRYAKKGNYVNYTYNDDMQGYAMLMLVRTWDRFDPERSSNPFAFFTQCIKHSFIQYLNQEKRQRDIRDTMLVDIGLTPSHTFQLEYEDEQRAKHSDDRVFADDEENSMSLFDVREKPSSTDDSE